jgi:hypothetical protein
VYSVASPAVAALVENEYDMVQAIFARNPMARASPYDQQDAFFLPLAGFHGITRPGPDFYVYRRRLRG